MTPEARRTQLMACALAVFARRGLGEARHAEIAAEAGVSVATVFFYFPTREALVEAVLDEVARFLLDLAGQLHSQDLPADEVLLAHLRAFAALLDSSPSHVRVWLDWSTAVREDSWQRYLVFLEALLAVIRRTLERGQRDGSISTRSAPDDQARLLVGSGHMLALMKIGGASADRLEVFYATLMESVTGNARPATQVVRRGRTR